MRKNPTVQAALLIGAALILAIVANGFASRTRKLMLPGYYPDALKVPVRVAPTPMKTAAPVATATVAPTETVALTTTATTTIATATITPTPTPPPTTTATATTTAAPKPPTNATPTQHSALSTQDLSQIAARFKPHPNDPYHEITGEEASALHAAGVLFLDARRTSVYEEGHVAGARSYSVWESDIDDKVNKLYEERSDPRDQDKPIVIYCSGGACEDSHMLSQKLWGIQFNNVYVYKDGFPDWQQRGGAVKTGGQP
jgi:rhodanese-related sulfurtransferase